MSATIKTADAKARFSELLARVEAGEEITISRGDRPVARLVPIPRNADAQSAIVDILSARSALGPTTTNELLGWRDAGRR